MYKNAYLIASPISRATTRVNVGMRTGSALVGSPSAALRITSVVLGGHNTAHKSVTSSTMGTTTMPPTTIDFAMSVVRAMSGKTKPR